MSTGARNPSRPPEHGHSFWAARATSQSHTLRGLARTQPFDPVRHADAGSWRPFAQSRECFVGPIDTAARAVISVDAHAPGYMHNLCVPNDLSRCSAIMWRAPGAAIVEPPPPPIPAAAALPPLVRRRRQRLRQRRPQQQQQRLWQRRRRRPLRRARAAVCRRRCCCPLRRCPRCRSRRRHRS